MLGSASGLHVSRGPLGDPAPAWALPRDGAQGWAGVCSQEGSWGSGMGGALARWVGREAAHVEKVGLRAARSTGRVLARVWGLLLPILLLVQLQKNEANPCNVAMLGAEGRKDASGRSEIKALRFITANLAST